MVSLIPSLLRLSRLAAQRLGHKRFFLGVPCRNGHLSERLTSNGTCIACNQLIESKRASSRYADPEYRRKLLERAKFNRQKSDKLQRANTLAARRYRSKPEAKARAAEYARQYIPRRMATDVQYKMSRMFRTRLRDALRGKDKRESALRLLGCSLGEVRSYLEAQFKPGMTWKNWTHDGWHIDHKRPLAWFNLEDPAQLASAFHYTNLQPLWSAENFRKGARWAD